MLRDARWASEAGWECVLCFHSPNKPDSTHCEACGAPIPVDAQRRAAELPKPTAPEAVPLVEMGQLLRVRLRCVVVASSNGGSSV